MKPLIIKIIVGILLALILVICVYFVVDDINKSSSKTEDFEIISSDVLSDEVNRASSNPLTTSGIMNEEPSNSLHVENNTIASVVNTTKQDEETTSHIHIENETEVTIIDPSCTNAGSRTTVVFCSCGYEMSSSTEVISALGHDYKKNTIEPTCLDNGYYQYICSRCQDSYTESDPSLSALGHKYRNGVCTRCKRSVQFRKGADIKNMNEVIEYNRDRSDYNTDSITFTVWEIVGKETHNDNYLYLGMIPEEEATVSVFLVDYSKGSLVLEKTGHYGDELYFDGIPNGKYYYAVEKHGYDSMFYYGPIVINRINNEPEETIELPTYTYTKDVPLSYSKQFKIRVVNSKGNGVQLEEVIIGPVTPEGEGLGGISWFHCTNSSGTVCSTIELNDEIAFSIIDGCYLGLAGQNGKYIIISPTNNEYCVVVY